MDPIGPSTPGERGAEWREKELWRSQDGSRGYVPSLLCIEDTSFEGCSFLVALHTPRLGSTAPMRTGSQSPVPAEPRESTHRNLPLF